jgi:4-hydroxybenzoate polyprenyltransferase
MGFLGCLFLANTNELILLFFIVLIASLYSFPYLGNIIFIFNLRALPYIKLILVVLIWTMSTVLLPYISYNPTLNNGTLLCITIERFGFLFAIIVPFDIRDIVDDRKLAIKTIPLLLGEKKSILLANVSLILYLISVFGYYFYSGQMLYLVSGIISFLVTFYIINAKSITKNRIYYELFLDGMILFQGMLIFISYQLKF